MTSSDLLATVTALYASQWAEGLPAGAAPPAYPAPYALGDLVVIPPATVDIGEFDTLLPGLVIAPATGGGLVVMGTGGEGPARVADPAAALAWLSDLV